MLNTIKARCVNGALVPVDAVELEEGAEYLMTLKLAPTPEAAALVAWAKAAAAATRAEPAADPEERLRLFKSTAGSWREYDAYWEEWVKDLHDEKIRNGSPTPPAE